MNTLNDDEQTHLLRCVAVAVTALAGIDPSALSAALRSAMARMPPADAARAEDLCRGLDRITAALKRHGPHIRRPLVDRSCRWQRQHLAHQARR